MRFMVLRKADKNTEAGVMPSTELLGKMGAFCEEMLKAGVMIGGEGLHPTKKAVRLNHKGGKVTVTDGPFAETKEVIAGYFLLQTKTLQEAIDWMKRWPREDGDVELEIRQIFEAEDFGAEFTPEQRAHEEQMRKELAAKQ